jgi:hypothetical protein
MGKFIAYISTPVSGRGGGNRKVNVEIARKMKERIEKRFQGRLWALDPSGYDLPAVQSRYAGGSEYMFMWSQILIGEDGLGKDFDIFFIVGPSDVRWYFAQDEPSVETDPINGVDRWIDRRSSHDPEFKTKVADASVERRRFLSFYGLKASASFSLGAHDEWNLFVEINKRIRSRQELGIPEQIPVIFDDMSLVTAEMETVASPGSALRCIESK